MIHTDPQSAPHAGPHISEQPGPAAPVAVLPSLALLQLRRLMRAEGWDLDVPRMCLDTAYAHHCLATAHTSSDARLRQVALALFETYGRNSTPPLH
jgi:hypothetical protein